MDGGLKQFDYLEKWMCPVDAERILLIPIIATFVGGRYTGKAETWCYFGDEGLD